jgi:hypothetical protein
MKASTASVSLLRGLLTSSRGLRLSGLARTVSCYPNVCRHRAVRDDVISQLTTMVVILRCVTPATIE